MKVINANQFQCLFCYHVFKFMSEAEKCLSKMFPPCAKVKIPEKNLLISGSHVQNERKQQEENVLKLALLLGSRFFKFFSQRRRRQSLERGATCVGAQLQTFPFKFSFQFHFLLEVGYARVKGQKLFPFGQKTTLMRLKTNQAIIINRLISFTGLWFTRFSTGNLPKMEAWSGENS